MLDFTYDLTPGIRALALLNVLLLLILYVVISAARKRQERMERKLDALLVANGLRGAVEALDAKDGRKSNFAPL